MALGSNPYAFEKEQYFSKALENPDLTKYDVDFVSFKIGDTGNEPALYELAERADLSSGQLGLMHTLERDVDDSVERVSGSRSKNLSEHGQEVQRLSKLPTVFSSADIEPAIAGAYETLLDVGVQETDLVDALAAGGPDNQYATFQALQMVAAEHGIDELVDYMAQAQDVIEAEDPNLVFDMAAPTPPENDARMNGQAFTLGTMKL